MIPVREDTFLLDASTSFEIILAALSEKFLVEETSSVASDQTFYDTFDWRLYRKKMICFIRQGRLVLQDFNGVELDSMSVRTKNRIFWRDLEPSKLTDRLKKHINMRALCPTLNFMSVSRTFKIMNRDRKTVTRFSLAHHTAGAGESEMELPEIFHLQAIRGYEKAYARVINALRGEPLAPLAGYIDLLDEAYGVAERQPLDYGAKFRVELDRSITVGQAVATIFLNLVETMEFNRQGVVDDIDSEFLHDFRIAVRRTRSLISLLRKVLPTGQIAPYETEFRWLGSVTGPLRDIDVYLLEKDDYKQLLPHSLAEGLDLFFNELEQQRGDELETLRGHLESQRYRDFVASWKAFLTDTESELFSGGGRQEKCLPLANRIIRKRFRSFLKDGDRIDDDTPDQALHRLRIKGKKFRYLLEFFNTFYAPDDVELFLKHMKNLQDNLGDFNDLSVQMEILEAKLEGLKGRNKQIIRLAAALGSLITRLKEEHAETRGKFKKTYQAFRTPENQQLISMMTSERRKDNSKGKL